MTGKIVYLEWNKSDFSPPAVDEKKKKSVFDRTLFICHMTFFLMHTLFAENHILYVLVIGNYWLDFKRFYFSFRLFLKLSACYKINFDIVTLLLIEKKMNNDVR